MWWSRKKAMGDLGISIPLSEARRLARILVIDDDESAINLRHFD